MRLAVKLDISKVEGLSDRLSKLTAEEFGRVAIGAVNAAADEVYQLVVPRMINTLNLTEDYVKQRMQVVHASNPNNVVAKIVASGSKPTMTQLARYGAKQAMVGAKRPARAKGDKLRGIPAGMKQSGVSVEVTRGSRKLITHGFLIPLRGGNGMGLATRTGKGPNAYKVRYGPSVYQMFKVGATAVLDDAYDSVETNLRDAANEFIRSKL